ncbi:uncharacterized protein LOC132736423 [Ruditapes philippinarum]|uniref:uncharacterized protein LOC132736423 n=1 Tax=Ruditapes philippinarum TaxID=129788 RepID=UPI00295AFB8D|nr:uncharacterized protein LOC132736423 [Ruditapes philippinarum]
MDIRKEEVLEEKKDDLSYLKDERKPTLKETLKELAESSSLHGIPKIVSSRQIVVKVLWSILVLAAFAVVSFQLYLLFKTYYSYPSQTSVSLDFSPIAFPAITLCNLNPVRKSQLHRSEDLRDLLSEDQVYARRKRGTEGTKSENKHLLDAEGKAMFKALTRNLNDETIKENKHAEGKGNNITDFRRENKQKVTFQKSTFSYLNRDKRLKSNNHEQLENTQIVRQNGEGLRNRREADTTTEETEASSTVTKAISDSVTNNGHSDELTSSTIDYDNDDDYDLYEDFYWDDWLSYNFEEDLYLEQLDQTKDEWDARVENFKKAIKIKPLHLRRKMGHQIEDMVQNVTFAGRVQKVRQSKTFTKNFTSAEYGNCYTMANRKFVALRSGPSNAMKLTLNVEIDEYIDNLSTGYGIRIVFHEHGTYPLPSHEGITLSPGSETNIGLRMVRISRLPEPHGNCSDGREFARTYQKKYSISACYEFCRILEIIELTVYTKTTSSTFWPSDDYLKVLITEVCNNESYSDFWEDPCSDMEKLASHELDKYRRNFLRVLIYYEDLNFELIEEEPIYEPVRFLSDIGGTMGLFLGASALTFVEILQLVLELILFMKHKN